MFHLVNKFGNVHKHVKDARKRDELIAAGYRLAEEPVEVASVEEPVVDGVAPYEGPQQVDDPLQMHTSEDDTQDAATEEGAQDAAADDVEKPKKGKDKKNDTKE